MKQNQKLSLFLLHLSTLSFPLSGVLFSGHDRLLGPGLTCVLWFPNSHILSVSFFLFDYISLLTLELSSDSSISVLPVYGLCLFWASRRLHEPIPPLLSRRNQLDLSPLTPEFSAKPPVEGGPFFETE